jgi:hypothetical protein
MNQDKHSTVVSSPPGFSGDIKFYYQKSDIWESLRVGLFRFNHVTFVIGTCSAAEFLHDSYFKNNQTNIQHSIFNSHVGEEFCRQFIRWKSKRSSEIGHNSCAVLVHPDNNLYNSQLFTVMMHLIRMSESEYQHINLYSGTYIVCPRCSSLLTIRKNSAKHIDTYGQEFNSCEEGGAKNSIKSSFFNSYSHIIPGRPWENSQGKNPS